MRLRITFQVSRVPLLYRNAFMSYLKEALRSSPSGEKRFQQLFHYENRTNKAPKPFCFAVRFLHDKVRFSEEKDTFTLLSPLHFYFSTSDTALFVDFYNGVINRKIYPFQKGDFTLNYPLSVNFLREKPILRESALFETLSPILIEDASHQPLLPSIDGDGERFVKELNYQTDAMLRGIRGEGLRWPLQFKPVHIKKEVVKHAVREREEDSRVYTFTCFSGSFYLQGDPQDLRDIQVLGLGRRRSQGFGMVEVVET